jgi:hypothetical protein
MAATYPGTVRTFTTKVNNIDVIDASHPNVLQEEVVAIETTLGVNPQVSSGLSGTYISAGTTFANVSARLDNIEKGITGDTHSQYLKTVGGASITATSAATVPLTVRGVASQTANLQEWRDSSGTLVAAIAPDGSLTDSGAVVEHDNLYILSWVFG